MNEVDPAELSALLDGELSAERAAEVRRAITQDTALRREYEQLARLDADLKATARAAVFQPRVQIPKPLSERRLHVAWVAFALLGLRLALKMLPLSLATSVEVAALALVVPWVLHLLIVASEQEHRALSAESVTFLR
jgi:anti-sigma factor RsiW